MSHVLTGVVLTADGEEIPPRPASPDAMACEHAISAKRVEEWWRREEARSPRRDVSMCGCCAGPCPDKQELCRFCRFALPEPRSPYGEASR